MFLVVLLYAFLALAYFFAKMSLESGKPIFFIGVRMILAGIILLGFLFVTRRNALRIKREHLFIFCRLAFFLIYLDYLGSFWSLPYVSSSKINLIFSLTPFFTAILAYYLLKERLSKQKIAGFIIGFIGIAPIIIKKEPGDLYAISLPDIVLLIAVIAAAYAWFDLKKLLLEGYSLLLINGFSMFLGGLGLFLTSLIGEGLSPSPIFDFWSFLFYLIVLIFVSNICFYNLYAYLLTKYSVTFLSFAGFLSPLFGAFLGWYFEDVPLTWQFWVALLLIPIAFYLFYREELQANVKSE